MKYTEQDLKDEYEQAVKRKGKLYAEGYIEGLKDAQSQALTIPVVMPRFLKTKYSLEKLDEHIHELSCRTEHWIHRGKLDDIEKLIRWRRRYDALNGA